MVEARDIRPSYQIVSKKLQRFPSCRVRASFFYAPAWDRQDGQRAARCALVIQSFVLSSRVYPVPWKGRRSNRMTSAKTAKVYGSGLVGDRFAESGPGFKTGGRGPGDRKRDSSRSGFGVPWPGQQVSRERRGPTCLWRAAVLSNMTRRVLRQCKKKMGMSWSHQYSDNYSAQDRRYSAQDRRRQGRHMSRFPLIIPWLTRFSAARPPQLRPVRYTRSGSILP
jgi:hypothetical protein